MNARSKPSEGRRHPRSPLGSRGIVRFADGGELIGVVDDVSYGGARIDVAAGAEPRPLVGKSVTLEVPLLTERSGGRLGVLAATVVWSKPAGNGRAAIGLRFGLAASAKLKLVLTAFRDDAPG